MKIAFKTLAVAATLAFASSAHAIPINVGGVVWDPDQTAAFPGEMDFTSHGGLLENSVDPANGIFHVDGRGIINQINSTSPNVSSFCPGCELTYTFSMDLAALPTPTGGIDINTGLPIYQFQFTNVIASIFVDHTPNYDGSLASANDGALWLSMIGKGNLNGTGVNIGTGSDTGSGSVLLDVIGGLAMGNFDTNTKLLGSDMVFSSSFQPAGFTENGAPMLTGTADIRGSSIPEPGSVALAGLGLLALGFARRRKV